LNSDGSTTEVETESSSVSNSLTTTTSANGLSQTIAMTLAGLASYSVSTKSTTVINSNGTKVETITDRDSGSNVLDQAVITLSADGLSTTTDVDSNGDGRFDVVNTTTYATDGSKTQNLSVYNPVTGALEQNDVIITSADGRTSTLSRDKDGNGSADHFETIVQNADGSVTDTNSATTYLGAPAYSQVKVAKENVDGGTTVTTSTYDWTGNLQSKATVVTSANQLSTVTSYDNNGDGLIDETNTDTTVLNADGSRTETVTDRNADTSLRKEEIQTTNANGLTTTTDYDSNGNGVFDVIDTAVTSADGSKAETISYYNDSSLAGATGTLSAKTVIQTTADGLTSTSTTTAVGSTISLVDATTLFANANGSYQWVQTVSGGGQVSASPSLASGSASHMIDANHIDTWSWNDGSSGGSSGSIRIDIATEEKDESLAQALTVATLNRQMTAARAAVPGEIHHERCARSDCVHHLSHELV
jgi:hypothetical protein